MKKIITKENLSFLVNIIKSLRPKFYDKITWVVVCAGLSLMSSSLLQKISEYFFIITLDINITGSSDVIWGFLLVCIGLIYNLTNTGFYELLSNSLNKEKKEKQSEHDKENFANSNEIMSEDQLLDFLQWLRDDHSYVMSKCRRLEMFCDFLSKNENQFVSEILKGKVKIFLSNSDILVNFISYRFHIYPDNQRRDDFRLCMEPALNIDRGGRGLPDKLNSYANLTKELDEHISKVYESYSIFRDNVKKQYFI